MMPVSLLHIPAGSPWWMFAAVIAALALHIGGGSVGILSGYGAVAVPKGERLHRLFGTAFVVSMLTMASMGVGLAVWNQQKGNIAGGVMAFYLVATAWMTVRRKEGQIGAFDYAALFVIAGAAAVLLTWGMQATVDAKSKAFDYAAPLYFVFGAFAVMATAMDVSMIRRGGLRGTQRIARHLWRMCFALFFAAASFFLGQQKVMPVFMHGSPFLFIPALAPLAVMIYWLVRACFGGGATRVAAAI